MISKPITILRQEFINSLVDLCNNSNLPYFCVESILKEVLDEVRHASAKQFEMDKNNYDNELKKAFERESAKGEGDESI